MRPISGPATFDGFLHVEDGRLVDGRGAPRLLRGVGLGNWLLPEGYMWGFDDAGPQSPRQIEACIEDLIGPAPARAFWARFRERFITEADIERIAGEGFDHVRLPINARLVMDDDGALLDEGMALIDRLIEWCRTHRLWVVLDLHGAPGGQTGTNIDDSPAGRPDLFLVGGRYRDLTIRLWERLVERYRSEPVVAGYDLLNEPLPNEYQDRLAPELVSLYQDLTTAIRAIDRDHLIIYEGTHWATNWSMFTEVWDPNSMLQFHKYWSAPDRPSIAPFIDIGERLGLPIYMGEGGENNLDWLQTAFQLYEDHGISWNFWPWKKVETRTSPVSVPAPAGWDSIQAFVEGRGPRPDHETAGRILADLLDALPSDRADDRGEVLRAMLRRVPVRLPATGFRFGQPGVAYGTRQAEPLDTFRSDDAVTIRQADGDRHSVPQFDHNDGRHRAPGELLVVHLGRDEWVTYEFVLRAPGPIRVALEAGWPSMAVTDAPSIQIDGRSLRTGIANGGIIATDASVLPNGSHILTVTAGAPDTVLAAIDLDRPV